MESGDQCNLTATIDVLILCGGAGSRLKPLISDRPKGLALIRGRPFLDILVEDLLNQGFQRIIFCVGHLKDQIIDHYKSRSDADFQFSEEENLLGTGGAIENALTKVSGDSILVINGDSICKVNFNELIQFHYAKLSSATFVLTDPQGRYDGGIVLIDDSNRVHSFLEKTSNRFFHKGFINAGIYLIQLDSLLFPKKKPPFSLEYDIFPVLTKNYASYGFVVDSKLVDIGTPERYLQANH